MEIRVHLQNIHTFRAFAIFGVVAAHSLHNFVWPERSVTFAALDTFFNQSTIWFAFIAGYLFQHLSSNYSTKCYYFNKIKNVITPYLVWSLPAIFIALLLIQRTMPNGFYDLPAIQQVILFLVTGKHLAPYWYIPTIVIIFLLSPLLIYIDRNPKLYVILIPSLIVSALLGRDGLLSFASLTPYHSSFSKALYLFSPYLLGMWASRYREAIKQFVKSYFLFLFLAAILFYFLEVLNYKEETYYIFLFKIISSFIFIQVFKNNFLNKNYVAITANYSFSIFFIHGYILSLIKFVNGSFFESRAFVSSNLFFYFMFVSFVMFICVYIGVKIKYFLGKNSKYFIGC